jgi:hypothetical protein
MIKNFDEIKSQLAELAPIINSFKSESVQLRIVELIFKSVRTTESEPDETLADEAVGETERPRKARKKSSAAKTSANSQKRKVTGSGPIPTLTELIEEGFLAKRQTLNQILEHCKSNKARIFRPNQFSGPLGRLVRDGKLQRQQNSESQYEYWKP